MQPITDYLTVSAPRENVGRLQGALTDVCLRIPGARLSATGVTYDGGRLHVYSKHAVCVATCSGAMLAGLRAHKLFFDYLVAVHCQGPYKVTHIDAALDLPMDAPPYLMGAESRLQQAGCSLTRKRVPPSKIKAIMAPSAHDGRRTGSIMIGHRATMETTACLYDKRNERLDAGVADPGPLLRVEVRTGLAGMTLRDAACPEALFYHVASPDLVDRPPDVDLWLAQEGGFTIDRPAVDAVGALRRLIDRSPDLDRMLTAAQALPNGDALLLEFLRQRIKQHAKGVTMQPASTALRGSEAEPSAPPLN